MNDKRPLTQRELEALAHNLFLEDDDDDNAVYSSGESCSDFEEIREDPDQENNNNGNQQSDVDDVGSNSGGEVDENMDSENFEFLWKFDPDWVPTVMEFDATDSGCNVDELNETSAEIQFFELFFTEEFIQQIVVECNRQYSYIKENDPNFARKYRNPPDVTIAEMFTFFSLLLLMTRTKKLRMYEYWSTDPLISTPIFTEIMTRDRFFFIMKVLHFCDNKQPKENDKLFKIRKPLDYLRNRCKSCFTPYKNICIDESLILFRGRLSFKQYILSKRHRFGVKLFMICDSKTKYCLDFIVYAGVATDLDTLRDEHKDIGKSGQIVLTLMKPYLNKNHALYLDNWYNSPSLAAVLHSKKTYVCGTVKKNRKWMPRFHETIKKGEMTFRTTSNTLVLKWCDKREIHMITTLHDYAMTSTNKKDKQTGKIIMKPTSIIDYNQNMGGVDQTDMLISSIDVARKSIKWYKKIMFHFLDMVIVNSHALYMDVTKKNSYC